MPNGTRIFSGKFERSMDAKKRVTVPAAWLSPGESQEFFSLVNPNPEERYLMVMPPEEFRSVQQKVEASDLPAQKKRIFMRHFSSNARTISVDKQGRILLPEQQCADAGLKDEVTLVGTMNRFEIWNPNRWNQTAEEESVDYQDVADSIGL